MQWIKAGLIFALALVAYFNFAPQAPENPQQVTRLALSIALSQGRVDIDHYAPLTIDKAEFDGHFYADKPPGLSLLAVPAVLATRAVLGGPANPGLDAFPAYERVAIVSTVGLLAALAAAVLYLLTRYLGASEAGAVFASCALSLGTPYFGWSTALFAHAASGGVLLLALALAIWGQGRGRWVAVLLGVLLGYQVVIDLVAAPAACLVGLYFVLSQRRDAARLLPLLVAGGLVGIAPLLIYNQIAFQSPFRLGYSQVVGFEGMKEGLFGLTLPDPRVLGELLFGHFRGLLPLSPVLLLVPIGLVSLWRSGRRGLVATICAIVLTFLLINASYYYWDGGSSTGPRHLIAMLPVACIGLAFAWPPTRASQTVALLLLGISMLISVVCAGVYMFADAFYPNPLVDPLLAKFLTPEGLLNGARVLVSWAGFVVVARMGRSGPQRDQLPA